jgi:CubicO group peptidase (beta-lactamase class C family)
MDPVGRYLKARIDEGRMPGAVGAIVGPSGIASEWVLGHAALEPERIEARVDTLYDLASLTKPLCTGLALASLEERGLCALDAPMVEWLPELEHSAYADASLLRFAAHTTGLPAWRPLYLSGNDAATFLSTIAALPVGELGGAVYSDLGYVCLGLAIERIAGRPLDIWFAESVATVLGLKRLGFATRLDCSAAAPTERGNAYERLMVGDAGAGHAWRRSMIRGEVHDGNAHALGGVAGHSGLFGTLGDVVALVSELLRPRALALGTRARARLFTEALPGSGRTVGFVQAAASSAARGVFAADAPGHVGFSGPSLWLEPERGWAYVLLTNRVHPVVDGLDFQPVRLGFHRLARALSEES